MNSWISIKEIQPKPNQWVFIPAGQLVEYIGHLSGCDSNEFKCLTLSNDEYCSKRIVNIKSNFWKPMK